MTAPPRYARLSDSTIESVAEKLFPPHVRAAIDAVAALSDDERRWLRAYMDVVFPGEEPSRGERLRALLIVSNMQWAGAKDKEALNYAFGAPVAITPEKPR